MHIGLFDSGMGGLVVLRELKRQMPSVRYSYLADLARLPYGDKPLKTLKQYRLENIKFLESLKVDIILIACHSISSFSLELGQTESGTPVYNMIDPCGKEVLEKTKNKKVGVIATKATVKTDIYSQFFKVLDSRIQVFNKACPLLVPMIEKGHTEGSSVEQTLKNYLDPLVAENIDTLLLGCSHYFLLQKSLSRVLDPSIRLIHPAVSVACFIKKEWEEATCVPRNDSPARTDPSMTELYKKTISGDLFPLFSKNRQEKNDKEKVTVYLTGRSSHFNECYRCLFSDLNHDGIIYTNPV